VLLSLVYLRLRGILRVPAAASEEQAKDVLALVDPSTSRARTLRSTWYGLAGVQQRIRSLRKSLSWDVAAGIDHA